MNDCRFVVLAVIAVCGMYVGCHEPSPRDAGPDVDGDAGGDGDVDAGDPLADFFGLVVHTIDVTLDEEAADLLTDTPRRWAHAAVEIDGIFYADVGLRLKGGMGSFVSFDGEYSEAARWTGHPNKWAFIIDFNRHVSGLDHLGLEKLTVNNLAQDPSGIHEFLAYALFREGGVPAARTAYALVTVNGEERGLYALVESQDNSEFLLRHYDTDEGNMYEGEYGVDLIGERVEGFDQDNGDDDTMYDIQDLARALDAIDEGDDPLPVLEAHFDVDEYLAFAATEIFVGHWDGYAWSANNYFVHHHPDTDVWTFLPWGVDQTFEDDMGAFGGVIRHHGEPWRGEGSRVHNLCLRSAECRQRLRAAFEAVIERVEAMDLQDLARRARDLVEPLLLEEAERFGEPEVITESLERTEAFIRRRPEHIAAWLPCLSDEFVDNDGDGFDGCTEDCHDFEPLVHPGAPERCNVFDDDCNGLLDDSPECPECFTEWGPGAREFTFCFVSRTWEEANTSCRDQGLELLSIHDEMTWDFATFVMWYRTGLIESWIGLNDRELEGMFQWTDGTPFDFHLWGYRRPNPWGEEEDCVMNAPWGWFDIPCGGRFPYMCH